MQTERIIITIKNKIMLKKVISLLLIIAPLSVFAQKFGHIYSNEVFVLMPEYTKAQTDIETMRKQSADDMKVIQEEFTKKYTAFQQEQATLPKNVLERRQKELQEMEEKAIQTAQDYERQLQQSYYEMMQPIAQKLNTAIKEVGQEGGYIYIFDLSASTNAPFIPYINEEHSTDVTNAVKAKLGIK